MTEQEINNLIDSKIGKTKMSQLPEATQTSGLYSIGYNGNQSVKYKANLLQGDPLTVRKTYQTEALALADKNPIDTTTSLPLKVGQFVSIVADTTTSKNGIYRISSISGDGTMSLELQGKLGDLSSYLTADINGVLKKGTTTVYPKTIMSKVLDEKMKKNVADIISDGLEKSGIHNYISGSNALSKYVGSDVDDTSLWKVGAIKDGIESTQVTDSRFTKDFIKLFPITYNKVVLNIWGDRELALYDENKGYIKKYRIGDLDVSTFPSNARYMKFSQNPSVSTNNLFLSSDETAYESSEDVFMKKESADFIDAKINELKAMYNFNYTNALPSEINEIPINETFWIKGKYFNYLNNTYPVDASYNVTKPIQLTKGVYKLFTRLTAQASGVVRNESGNIVYKFRRLDVTEDGYYLNIEEDNWTLEFSIYENDVDTVRLLKFETSVFPSKAEFNSAIKSIQNNTTLLDTRTELLENNLDVYNEQFNYIPSGTNLLTGPLVLDDLRRGYRNVSTGTFVDNVPYYTTDKIMISRGSKVEIKGFYNISNAANIAVYIFNGEQYIKGIPFDSSLDEVTNEGNIYTVTIPEDMFNGSGIHSIEIAGYVEYFDRYDLKVRTYGDTINIGNMSGGGDSASSLIKIPTLANGTEINIPHTIYDNLGEVNEEYMGNPLAKTVLRVPISSAHNVRFKFKVEEDLLRLNKTAVIFDGGGLQVKAEPVPITQQTVDFIDDNDVSQTSYLPVLIGGINYITDESSSPSRNRGEFAFSVQYTGDVNNEASIENTGSEVVLKVNSAVVADLSFVDYPKMSLLYQAIGSVADFEVDFNELEARVPQDLVIFPEIKLVSTFKNKIGGQNSEEEIYRDAAKVHIPYSVDTNWHHVEIVSLKGITYLLIDGAMTKVFSLPLEGETDLIFGGECGVVFKDIEIDTLTTRDAEIVMYAGINETVISTMNPLITIWEGHGMYTHASHEEEVHTDDMQTTTDRLQHIFSLHKEKGYLPVSIYDIRDWYYNGKELPKRCYTVLFDDWQFDNYLNLKKRSVFTRFNVKPLICTVTDRSYSSNYKWTYNGVDITAEKAFDIGRRAGFSNISHTRLHRTVTATKYSEYEQEWILDMYSADEMGVHSSMLSYPGGNYNTYMTNTFKWCGGNIAIGVYSKLANRRHKSPYDFRRLELGLRESIEKIKESIV